MSRTASLRAHLLREIEPAMERLKGEIAAMLEQRVRGLLASFEEAFAVALSAVESQDVSLPRGPLQEGSIGGRAEGERFNSDRGGENGKEGSSHGAAGPVRSAATPGPVCSKCKEPGHNARSCGRTPKGRSRRATSDKPLSAIAPNRPRLTPADIEASKARIAARRDRNAVRSGISAGPPPDDRPIRWSDDEIEAATTIAEAGKLAGSLPDPEVSFERDFAGGEFREVEF